MAHASGCGDRDLCGKPRGYLPSKGLDKPEGISECLWDRDDEGSYRQGMDSVRSVLATGGRGSLPAVRLLETTQGLE
jgi:hypothetical protein